MGELVKKNDNLLPALMREVEDKIVVVRGQKTLLDRDVAAVYGVETKRVNEAVRNNPRKFPKGYVFELTDEESAVLRSKISTIETSSLTLEDLRSNSPTLEGRSGKGHHGDVLSDIVMPDLQIQETESSLEINFFIGKIKHTVKRVRKEEKR